MKFFIGFLIFWAFMSYTISFFGWFWLARKYKALSPFIGKKWGFQSAIVGIGMNYNSCLTIGANTEGIYFSISFPFRIGHPPLFIPWDEISAEEKQGLFFKRIRLHFSKSPSMTITIWPKIFKEISNLFWNQPSQIRINQNNETTI
ncbi:MAG: hypothetical protein ACMUIP_14385 [bacterium]